MKPEEHDVVRLVRPLPERGLPAGSRGPVVMDYMKSSNAELPPAYEVEFADTDGLAQALVTISEDDLEVVWRPDSGQ